MRLLSFVVAVALVPTLASAATFTDNFEGAGPSAAWTPWQSYTQGTLSLDTSEAVSDPDLVPNNPTVTPVGPSTAFGKLAVVLAGGGSYGRVAGDVADTNYSLTSDVYCFVSNAANDGAGPNGEDFWYQMLVFYDTTNGWMRFHTHFNQTNVGNTPRIRLQESNPTIVTIKEWTSADFTPPTASGWYRMSITAAGAQVTAASFNNVALPGTPLNFARTAGRWGFGSYYDGPTPSGETIMAVDNFTADGTITSTGVSDWSQFE